MSTVPKVRMVVTVSVVRFSDRTRTLVEVMSSASMLRSSFSSATDVVKSSDVMAAASPFRISDGTALVGV